MSRVGPRSGEVVRVPATRVWRADRRERHPEQDPCHLGGVDLALPRPNTFVTKFRSEVVLPPPDQLRQMIVEELPFWGKIIRDNNIKSGAG